MRIISTIAWLTVCFWTLPAAGQFGGAVPGPPPSATTMMPPAHEPPAMPVIPPAAPSQFNLSTPRASLMTFFAASAAGDFASASEAMDFSRLQAVSPQIDRADYARRLKALFDRQGSIDLQTIPDQPQGGAVAIHLIDDQQTMTLDRGLDGQWRFTAAGVARIDELEKMLGELEEELATDEAAVEHKLLSLPLVKEVLLAPVPYLNVELYRIVMCALTMLMALMAGRFARYFFTRTAERLEGRGRQFTPVVLRSLAKAAVVSLLAWGASFGIGTLGLAPATFKSIEPYLGSLNAMTVGFIAWCLVDVVNYWLTLLSAKTNGKLDDMLVPLASKTLRGTIVTMTLVQVATIVSEKPVTSVIAGLGIGGLAIGLAAQDAIKNLFGSVMIFTDRPFETGDRIVVDGHDGPVELVGFRSTRIRTSDGHLVTIPNGELANKTILNIGKPPFLKKSMTVKLDAKTPPDQLEKAVSILREILKDHEGMHPRRPPAVNFTEIAENSLNVAVSYCYSPPEGSKFALLNERVNFEILKRFQAAGVRLASPTQTLELSKGAAPQVLPMLKHAA